MDVAYLFDEYLEVKKSRRFCTKIQGYQRIEHEANREAFRAWYMHGCAVPLVAEAY